MASLLFSLLILALCHHVNSQDLSSDDQTILLNLKHHWGDPPSLDSWNSLSSPCNWPEIECTFGAVTSLRLAGKNINGTIPTTICYIPSSLYNCSNLEILDFSRNVISGVIPGELFLMKRLRQLSLYGNRLFGEVPIKIESQSLTYMDLSDNQLNGTIPDEIRNLNLSVMDLSVNSFSGSIADGVFRIHRLYYLPLAYNNLSGELPENMSLFSLQSLNLTHNRLYGTIPKGYQKLVRLSSLDLSYNQLSGDITDNMFRMRSKMSVIRLCFNKFSGKIPYELLDQSYTEHCFDVSNLCSDNRTEGLPGCPSRLCNSNYRIRSFLKCRVKHDKKHLLIIISVTIGCGIMGSIIIFYYLARKCLKMMHERMKILPSNVNNQEKEWEMISFQKLDFNETDILSSLTNDNLIGNGGSGSVYRVIINQSTGHTVAVKSIRNERKSDERLEKEFLAEIQTLGIIRHYNIVKILCCISGNNMKLLVESSPVSISSITKLDWPMRLRIAIGAAQGLCYLHHDCSPPIIHRDIKSSNILLDSEFNSTPKISEYAYTSKVNVKTDVYSFGVVLLELTTGRKAISGDDHMNLAERVQMHYREPSYLVESILDDEIKESSYLDQIVAVFRLGVMCTTTSPSNRPSMRDCVNILQNCTKKNSSSRSMIW
ncbi:hypothetical protein ACJIZ3_001610 [Penstemon smallii]|uniref:Protein kinase domain-containing protein n=1 Tax=Penstemon smallii TaxID=265156 RepID=A0ABD3U787_9LAMI